MLHTTHLRCFSWPFQLLSCVFHNKLDIFLPESWDRSRVLLICSHLAVSQLAHYGDRLLMKVKAGCGDNYSYRQIGCCSESITMSFGCDGDFLQILPMTNNGVINMAAICYPLWRYCRCSHFGLENWNDAAEVCVGPDLKCSNWITCKMKYSVSCLFD